MLLLTIIVGMVFGIARTSLALGNTIVETQNEEMLHQAFFELLSQRFSALPGNTRFDSRWRIPAPTTYPISRFRMSRSVSPGAARSASPRPCRLSTVKRRSGYLDIVLRYYENEILEGSESTFGAARSTRSRSRKSCCSRMSRFSNGGCWTAARWSGSLTGKSKAACRCRSSSPWPSAQGEEIRQIFWVPPKQNPEVMMRQMMQSGGAMPVAAPAAPGGGDARRRRWKCRLSSQDHGGGGHDPRWSAAAEESSTKTRCNMPISNSRRSRRGAALMAVLWLIAILAHGLHGGAAGHFL